MSKPPLRSGFAPGVCGVMFKMKLFSLLIIILVFMASNLYASETSCKQFKSVLLEPEKIDEGTFYDYCEFLIGVEKLRKTIISIYGFEVWDSIDNYDSKLGVPAPRGTTYLHFEVSINSINNLTAYLDSLDQKFDPSIRKISIGEWGMIDIVRTESGWKIDFGSQLWEDRAIISEYRIKLKELIARVEKGELPALIMKNFFESFYHGLND